MKQRFAIVVLVAWASLAAVPTSADTIWSSYVPFTPGPDAWTGPLDAIGIVTGADGTVIVTDRQVASPFTVASSWTVDSYTPVLDVFSLEYGLNGRLSLWSGDTSPTTLVESGIAFAVPTSTYYPQAVTIASVGRPVLEPGVTYWLMIQAAGPADGFSWGIAASPFATGQRLARADGGDWAPAGTQSAFAVDGTASAVPEPATLLIVGTGLIAAWGARRREG